MNCFIVGYELFAALCVALVGWSSLAGACARQTPSDHPAPKPTATTERRTR